MSNSQLPQIAAALSRDELRRYSRHLILPQVGMDGQRRLKEASVIVVGTGGLGSPISLYLAAAGVGRIGLVDFDVVDVTNLQRQIAHSEATVGRPKVLSAAERLRGLNPHIAIETFETPLTSHNALDILGSYDIILDGTDNFPTRYLLNDAAVLLGKPLVYGSVYRFEGQVSVFGAPGGPCYRCMLPEPPPAHLVPSCAEAGVLGVLPGTIGTLQATEALKLVLGIGEPLVGRLLLYDALDMTFDTIILPRRAACPLCGDTPTITELVDYEEFCGAPAHDGSAYHRVQDAQQGVRSLTPRQVQERMASGEPPILLDIREPYELLLSRLENALHIPLSQMDARWREIPDDRPVVVLCHHGIRSVRLIRRLQAQGHANLINLEGGIDAWSRQVNASIPRY
ncbi:MAG: molybdopterin-synthase adenylyltransferase MoeB [Anaerolineae bacterium]|nr:molybdopterin-synthase adenylyltransferase MoeB [Anaerolineae bacterium]